MRKLILALFLVLPACGDDDAAAPTIDAGGGSIDVAALADANQAPDASCYQDPSTHFEIINACTTATSVQKARATPDPLPELP